MATKSDPCRFSQRDFGSFLGSCHVYTMVAGYNDCPLQLSQGFQPAKSKGKPDSLSDHDSLNDLGKNAIKLRMTHQTNRLVQDQKSWSQPWPYVKDYFKSGIVIRRLQRKKKYCHSGLVRFGSCKKNKIIINLEMDVCRKFCQANRRLKCPVLASLFKAIGN